MKEYQLNVDQTSWSGAMPLDEIAIQSRLETISAKMKPLISKGKPVGLRIDDIRCLKQTEVDFNDAENALAAFTAVHGVSALVNKVIKMTIDNLGPRANWAYKTTVGKDMEQVGPSCHWCESKDCANCSCFK